MSTPQKPDAKLVKVSLTQPRYDQSTFWGRLRHFLQVTDVRTVFTTQKQLDEALNLLKDYESKGCPPVTESEAEKLWDAKKTRDAIIHPQTKEKVPLAFRFSSFVPMNVGVVAGMLLSPPTIFNTILWQWMNQSYNLALNHSNRNASNELSNSTVIKTYAGAVGISCGVAVGLGQWVKRGNFTPAVRATMQRFVPFIAVATAGIANVFMMRWNEARDGIEVTDEQGNSLGKSKKAGVYALSQVSFSRVMTALPVLTFPPIILGAIERTQFWKKYPRTHTPINLAVITAMLWGALPVAIAIFPQYVETSPKSLEPEFQNLKDKNGNPITKIIYNRGL